MKFIVDEFNAMQEATIQKMIDSLARRCKQCVATKGARVKLARLLAPNA